MSTILKALRRLEEDKQAQAARSLEQAVVEPAAARRRLGLGPSITAGIAAALGVIAIAWSLRPLWLPVAEPVPAVAARPADAVPSESLVAIEDAPRPPPSTPVALAPTTARSRIAAVRPPSGGSEAETPATVRPDPEALARAEAAVAARAERRARLAARTATPERSPAPMQAPVPQQAQAPTRAPAPRQGLPTQAPVPRQQAAKPAPVVAERTAPAPEAARSLSPSREPSPAPVVATAPERTPQPVPQALPPQVLPAVAAKPAKSNLARAAAQETPSAVGLAVQQIIWHPRAERRVAVVAVDGESIPRRLGEGAVVAGYTVARIGISDIELERDGVSTKRRVGSN